MSNHVTVSNLQVFELLKRCRAKATQLLHVHVTVDLQVLPTYTSPTAYGGPPQNFCHFQDLRSYIFCIVPTVLIHISLYPSPQTFSRRPPAPSRLHARKVSSDRLAADHQPRISNALRLDDFIRHGLSTANGLVHGWFIAAR